MQINDDKFNAEYTSLMLIMVSSSIVAHVFNELDLKISYYAVMILGANAMILNCEPNFWKDFMVVAIKETHKSNLNDMMKHLEFLKKPVSG